MAWHYRHYAPSYTELARLEGEGRAARRGLWSNPRPVPPWEWRMGGGEPTAPAGTVIANRNSHVYHVPTCEIVRRMAERNRVEFSSADEAVKAGYRKAGDCR